MITSDHPGVADGSLQDVVSFEPGDLGDAYASAPAACQNLMRLRNSTDLSAEERRAIATAIARSPFMRVEALEDLARRVGFRAMPYDHGAVTLDGSRELISTGDPFTGTAPTGWPCGSRDAQCPSGAPHGAPHEGSLACSYVSDCFAHAPSLSTAGNWTGDFIDRVRLTQRFGRAATTLRLLTGVGLSALEVPFLPAAHAGAPMNRWAWSPGERRDAYASAYGFNAPVSLTAGNTVTLYTSGSGRSSAFGTVYCENLSDEAQWMWTHLATGLDASCAIGSYPCTRIEGGCYAGANGVYATDIVAVDATPLATSIYVPADEFYSPLILPNYDFIRPDSNTSVVKAWDGIQAADPLKGGFVAGRIRGLVSEALNRLAGTSTNPDDLDAVLIGARDADLRVLSDMFVHVDIAGTNMRRLNRASLIPDGLTSRDVLDAMELACRVAADETTGAPCDPAAIEQLQARGVSDIASMERIFQCAANSVETAAQGLVLRNVPAQVVDAIQASGGAASGSALEGSRGAQLDQISANLIGLRSHAVQIQSSIRQLQFAARNLRRAIESAKRSQELIKVQMTAGISSAVSACVRSIGSGDLISSGGLGVIGAAATCGDAAVQIGAVVKSSDIQQQLSQIGLEGSYDEFNTTFGSAVSSLALAQTDLASSQHALGAALTALRSDTRKTRDALARASVYGTTAAGRQLFVNTVYRRRFTTAQDRYRRAHENAIRWAFLAKQAIEQRIGMRLADMHQDLGIVAAPATWESNLCNMTGIDYARIRSEGSGNGESYADEFVGDYVTNLENLIEGYRQRYPFHEGTDTAIFSLRDQVMAERDYCADEGRSIPVGNLIRSSETLAPAFVEDDLASAQSGWYTPASDCGWSGTVPLNSAGLVDSQDCAVAVRTSGLASASAYPLSVSGDLGGAVPIRVSFKQVGGTIRQNVSLPASTYWLSWYGLVDTAHADPRGSVALADASGQIVAAGVVEPGTVCLPATVAPHWCRYVAKYVSARPFDGMVEVRNATAGKPAVLAGLQLEDMSLPLSRGVDVANLHPSLPVATDGIGNASLPICEDTDGSVFRSHWRYDCMRLCPGGFRTDCSAAAAARYCYWEREFAITEADLSNRGRFERAGFAVGNYNYRFEDVGFNVVGSNIRVCDGTTLPSTCYSDGTIPISIEHNGPFTVRNHIGDVYYPQLFDGRIEHARALTAERYLTNPLSSADRSLIEPMLRREFRGRPLTGNYVIRVWDTGEVDFDAVEDIQLLVSYRYWTRFN